MEAYRDMLTYIKSAVTRNYSEKCINNIMDFVSGSASQNFSLLQEFYQTTLRALEEAKNEVWCCPHLKPLTLFINSWWDLLSLIMQRLWFKTNLKLCKIWFDMGEYGRMSKVILTVKSKMFFAYLSTQRNMNTIQFLLLDFEGTPQILSKRRWHWWSEERNTIVGGLCHWNSNVHWDKE